MALPRRAGVLLIAGITAAAVPVLAGLACSPNVDSTPPESSDGGDAAPDADAGMDCGCPILQVAGVGTVMAGPDGGTPFPPGTPFAGRLCAVAASWGVDHCCGPDPVSDETTPSGSVYSCESGEDCICRLGYDGGS